MKVYVIIDTDNYEVLDVCKSRFGAIDRIIEEMTEDSSFSDSYKEYHAEDQTREEWSAENWNSYFSIIEKELLP